MNTLRVQQLKGSRYVQVMTTTNPYEAFQRINSIPRWRILYGPNDYLFAAGRGEKVTTGWKSGMKLRARHEQALGRYAKRIHNAGKKAYALAYIKFATWGMKGKPPGHACGYMAAQAVRMNVDEMISGLTDAYIAEREKALGPPIVNQPPEYAADSLEALETEEGEEAKAGMRGQLLADAVESEARLKGERGPGVKLDGARLKLGTKMRSIPLKEADRPAEVKRTYTLNVHFHAEVGKDMTPLELEDLSANLQHAIILSLIAQKVAKDGLDNANCSADIDEEVVSRRVEVAFEVVVGNIGGVYGGDNYLCATRAFNDYVKQSKSESGRAAGETVTLFHNGEVKRMFEGEDFGGEEQRGQEQ